MKDYKDDIRRYIEMEKQVLDSLSAEEINNVMNVLENGRLTGKRIFICGNGGSASTASHFESDFNKGISYEQDIKYDIECLSDNVPMMMAIANDIGYDDIFLVPLKNKLKAGDIVIGISGSGNSENVVRALGYANEAGAETIAFTGYDGGRLKAMAKHNIHVAVNNMQITEDIHLVLNHMMMYILSGMKGDIDAGISGRFF
ncbi:MAG: SIS domain-containing protein [Lachnospiraceae bacterium]|nr:SIS domain-containing protein [Lachnospiraceae bacterium]